MVIDSSAISIRTSTDRPEMVGLTAELHTFEERDAGTLCRDLVTYHVPAGFLFDRLFVRRDLRRIFAFRQEVLRRRFPASGSASAPPSPRRHRTRRRHAR